MYKSVRQFDTFPQAFISGKIAVYIFVLGSIISMIIYPDYNLREKYLSELGARSNSALIFNVTIILTSILIVPIFIETYRQLNIYLSLKDQKFLFFGVICGFLSSICLFFVGLIPALPDTLMLHNLVAMMFFIFLTLTFSSLSMILIKLQLSNPVKPKIMIRDLLGFLFIPMVIILVNFNTWYSILFQKIIVYTAIAHILYLMNRIYYTGETKRSFYQNNKLPFNKYKSLDKALLMHNGVR